ncbi:MAG: IS1634 family transposase [Candidatus Latescibacteria bacterium]|nr:IS1634 family transposase [Candidatus Latescibacterota bacterium]
MDIPLLLAQLDQMGIAPLLDQHFPTHGHWQGLSLGHTSCVWLTCILSEANHRLSHVEPWAQERLGVLEGCVGQPVRALDVSDDRLASLLDQFSADEAWEDFECDLNRRLLRVYDLAAQMVRTDSTTAKSYTQSVEGLFAFGHSKDHRPDLPQVKINVSCLDPLGLPLTTTVVRGQVADDGLYVPEIGKVQQHLGRHGVTDIGDCKMGAAATRAFIAACGDYDLCPLSGVQVSERELAALLAPVWTGPQPLRSILRADQAEAEEGVAIAEGYEYTIAQQAAHEGRVSTWQERRLVIRSLAQAHKQERALRARVDQALAALAALNDRRQGKKRWNRKAELALHVEAILAQHEVRDVLAVHYRTTRTTRPLRRYRDRPATVRIDTRCQVQARVDETALAAAIHQLGWRVYATNQPAEQLSLDQAVWAYRAEYRIERGFARLKGTPLSLTPLYLTTPERIVGLIRLLMLAMRTLTLVEFQVRKTLEKTGHLLRGLYPGQPGRANPRPTAEVILRAFGNITLTRIREGPRWRVHITPLTPLQQQLVQLAGFQTSIYEHFDHHF